MKKNLLVISDGNGVDTDFKKWPTLLKILTTKKLNVINYSVIGASNEMMLMRLAEVVNKQKIDYAIIQWTNPHRFDVMATEFWQEQAKADADYNFNLVDSNNIKWWVTSASSNPYIQDYHNRYVTLPHALMRSQANIIAAAELLKFYSIEFAFTLCYAFDFSGPYQSALDSYPWIWHKANKGISDYRYVSEFLTHDTGKPQPHPLIGLDWINQVLKPGCAFIDYDDEVYYNIKQSLLKHV